MFSMFMNNINFRFFDNKYHFENIQDFYKSDFEELCSKSEKEIISIFIECGILNGSATCTVCGTILNKVYFETGRHPFLRCSKKHNNRIKIVIYKNTIFDGIKINIKEVLNLLYSFACRRSIGDASETLNLSKHTVMAFYKLFRASICFFLEKYSVKMGGSGVVIHFDETPITSRHGNTGRFMTSNTVWAVGAVDIVNRSCFLKFLPSRSRADLYYFINEWILPNSVIHTDSLASYHTLSSLGFTHFSVNHSRNLVGPDGIHTNWIEGIFGAMKKMMRKYDSNWSGVENLNLHLSEFCFRYCYDMWNRKKSFLGIMFVLKKVRIDLNNE